MRCVNCGNEARKGTTDIKITWKGSNPIVISGIPAYICDCGEEYFDEEYVDLIQALSRGYAEGSQEMPDYLNVKEVAEFLRISTQSVYNMLKDGRLKANKVGREWRFSVEDIRKIAAPEKMKVAALGQTLTENDVEAIKEALRVSDGK